MRRKLIITFIILVASCSSASAYEVVTHAILSYTAATQESTLKDASSGVLESLCLGKSADDPAYRNYLFASDGSYFTPAGLIQYGAIHEDDDLGAVSSRSINHFFDPQQGGIGFTGGLSGQPSPSWALEDKGDFTDQPFSYKDAKDNYYAAITSTLKFDRDKKLGAVFEDLGHIIHHLQDMAQPQHVRNDSHCDSILRCGPVGKYEPSEYEKYTLTKTIAIPMLGYTAVDYATFDKPRDFWETTWGAVKGKGIAQFTANNFVSIDTNFRGDIGRFSDDGIHHSPSAASAIPQRRQIEDIVGPIGPDQPLRGEIWFLSTVLFDEYRPSAQPRTNDYTSSYSIFNSDLTERGFDEVFTLNRLTYDAANEELLPRVVGYSAGLINYFFRGRIEITPPVNGMYSVIDHAVTNSGSVNPPYAPQGFTKLKFKLRNITAPGTPPSGSPVQQEMTSGTFKVIAKYGINPCYTSNLSGEFAFTAGGVLVNPSCSLLAYYDNYIGNQYISMSKTLAITSLSRTSTTDVEADFSEQPIPINARDLILQVVYKGLLGTESEGIALGYKNISEPTYFTFFNSSDYFRLNSQYMAAGDALVQVHNDPVLKQQLPDSYVNPEPFTNLQLFVNNVQLAGPVTVPIDGYVRLVFLGDLGKYVPAEYRYQTTSVAGRINYAVHYLTPATIQPFSDPAYIHAPLIFRAMRAHYVTYIVKSDFGSTDPSNDEVAQLASHDLPEQGPVAIPLLWQ